MINLQEVVRITVNKKTFTSAKEMDSDYKMGGDLVKTISTKFMGNYTLKLYNWGGARQYFVMESEKSKKVLVSIHVYRWGNTGWRVESTSVRPTAQGSGLGLKTYIALIKETGLTLVSGKQQSGGAQKLWAALSKQRGIEVYGYDPKAKENKFFHVEMGDVDMDSPAGAVYVDKFELDRLEDERWKELKSATTVIQKNKIKKTYKTEMDDIRRGRHILIIATAKKGLSKAK